MSENNPDYNIPTVNMRLFINTTTLVKTYDAPYDVVRQLVRSKAGMQPPVIEVENLKNRVVHSWACATPCEVST
jgi:hypothetical protein